VDAHVLSTKSLEFAAFVSAKWHMPANFLESQRPAGDLTSGCIKPEQENYGAGPNGNHFEEG
jgi:hypothetical protein